MAKCIIEIAGTRSEVSVENPIEDIYDLWDMLVKPAILGAGYMNQTVEEMFKTEKAR
jgi:hypothetical protein